MKLYREAKLWLVCAPALALGGWLADASLGLANQFPGDSMGEMSWTIIGALALVCFVFGCVALVACTLALLWRRVGTERLKTWITTDD